jgi:hypothetical protein
LDAQVRSDRERQALSSIRIFICSSFNDLAGFGIARQVEIGKPEMVDPTIDAVDDRIGSSFQLVVKAAFDEPSDHAIRWLIAM